MEFDALRAAVVPGGGVVGRWPGLICVAECEDRAVLRRLLDVCASTAGPDPGRTVARRLAMWLGGPDAPGSGLRFGTVAISGDQWAVFLFGSVGLIVPGSGIELSGADAATWTDRLLSRQDTPGVLVLEDSPVPADLVDGVHDLRSGVVPGAGAVLVQVRRNSGGDKAEEIASRRTPEPTWPDLVDVPGELERSPWSMTDTGPLATSRPTMRQQVDGIAEDSPMWRGVLGGRDAMVGDVLSGDLSGGDILGGDLGDSRSGGNGSATGRTGSGLSGAGWPATTRRTGPDRSSGPSGARRGRAGRSGASRGGLGANGSVLRAVGSRDFERPERGGADEGASRDDSDGGRADDSGPPGAASVENEPRLGSAGRESERDTSGGEVRDPATTTSLNGSPPPAEDRRTAATEAGAGRSALRPVVEADPRRDERERGQSGRTVRSGAADAQARASAHGGSGALGKGRGAAGDAAPDGGAPGGATADAGEPGAASPAIDERRARTGADSTAAAAARADSRPADDSGPAAPDGADAGRAGGGESRSTGSGRVSTPGAGSNRAGVNGGGANRAGSSGAGSNDAGVNWAGSTGPGANGSGANRAANGAGVTGAAANGAAANGAAANGAAANGTNGAGTNGAGANRIGSTGAAAGGAGSTGAVVNGADSKQAKQNPPPGRTDTGRATRGGDTGRAGAGGAATGAASARTGSGPAAQRGGEADRAERGAPGADRGDAGRGPSGRNGSTGTGKAEARRGTSGGGPRSVDIRSADRHGADPRNADPGRSGDSRADQGRADRSPTDGGSGAAPDVRDPAGAQAGSGGGVAVVSRLVPRDTAGGAATPAIDETSVGSLHPLADPPRRRPAAGGAESSQPESDQWFASNTDIAEAAAPSRQGRPRHGRPETEDSAAAQKAGAGAPAQAGPPVPPGATTQTQLRAERVLGVVQADAARPQEAEPAPVGVASAEAATTSVPSGDAAEADSDSSETPQVRGHLCPRGHLNDPRAQFCLSCGSRVEDGGGGLVSGPRPPLGMLIFDDGVTHTVDADHLVGRMPEADPRVRAGSLRSLLIEDPSGAVSRVHAEIRLNGWDVLLVDSGSRNGTFVAGPGESAWTPLPARQSRWLVPGTRVRLGGRTFLFEAPPGVR
ncbi:FHA domain-containing protein [Pseudonocardia alaniniphila]|uniref:FHA domain-containing protein n=1 Tax=Pseudonocardia alaniniphila TaxID=75291 RepID=A0ABS9TM04_9PSEU|nr:FHA domain-containing protein [Pseudonocardia alaniniphila]MCH6169423.1 FHA domain-containing protein [Pseudonocardia alaniniphila]